MNPLLHMVGNHGEFMRGWLISAILSCCFCSQLLVCFGIGSEGNESVPERLPEGWNSISLQPLQEQLRSHSGRWHGTWKDSSGEPEIYYPSLRRYLWHLLVPEKLDSWNHKVFHRSVLVNWTGARLLNGLCVAFPDKLPDQFFAFLLSVLFVSFVYLSN